MAGERLMVNELARAMRQGRVGMMSSEKGYVGPAMRTIMDGKRIDFAAFTKFYFDSGADAGETVVAVRETALNMLEAGLFHLTFPRIWIEDVFAEEARPMFDRYCYLVYEEADYIAIRLFVRNGDAAAQLMGRRWLHVEGEAIIPLVDPSDDFAVKLKGEIVHAGDVMPEGDIARGTRASMDVRFAVHSDNTMIKLAHRRMLAEAVYAVKKFVVTLNARGTIREEVDPRVRRRGEPKPKAYPGERLYPFTILRVPTDDGAPAEGGGGAPGGKRRMHLVRGYTWGKNTRPPLEQRWIEPFWRGSKALGTVPPKPYIVR